MIRSINYHSVMKLVWTSTTRTALRAVYDSTDAFVWDYVIDSVEGSVENSLNSVVKDFVRELTKELNND